MKARLLNENGLEEDGLKIVEEGLKECRNVSKNVEDGLEDKES